MTTSTKFKVIYAADYGWLEVAENQGMEIDWDSNPDLFDMIPEIIEVTADIYDDVDIDQDDPEVGFATVVDPRECDEAIQPGDIIVTSGHGGDVIFIRLTN